MTIEQKAKRYEEALERAKIWQEHLYESGDNDYAEELSYIFPELKESEDERIRKEIIDFLRLPHPRFIGKRDHEKWIAWLEKQGEKESDPRYKYIEELLAADDIYQMAMNDTMVEEARTKVIEAISKIGISQLLGIKKQCKQIPVWSEEDERLLNATINTVLIGRDSCEEDDEVKDRYDDELNWLKSLKERVGCEANCTTMWKPSEEQMKALAEALSLAKNCGEESAFDLRTLHEQLKKLKEEQL